MIMIDFSAKTFWSNKDGKMLIFFSQDDSECSLVILIPSLCSPHQPAKVISRTGSRVRLEPEAGTRDYKPYTARSRTIYNIH